MARPGTSWLPYATLAVRVCAIGVTVWLSLRRPLQTAPPDAQLAETQPAGIAETQPFPTPPATIRVKNWRVTSFTIVNPGSEPRCVAFYVTTSVEPDGNSLFFDYSDGVWVGDRDQSVDNHYVTTFQPGAHNEALGVKKSFTVRLIWDADSLVESPYVASRLGGSGLPLDGSRPRELPLVVEVEPKAKAEPEAEADKWSISWGWLFCGLVLLLDWVAPRAWIWVAPSLGRWLAQMLVKYIAPALQEWARNLQTALEAGGDPADMTSAQRASVPIRVLLGDKSRRESYSTPTLVDLARSCEIDIPETQDRDAVLRAIDAGLDRDPKGD